MDAAESKEIIEVLREKLYEAEREVEARGEAIMALRGSVEALRGTVQNIYASESELQARLDTLRQQVETLRAVHSAVVKVWEHEHTCSQCRGHYYCAEQNAMVRDWDILEMKLKETSAATAPERKE